jgi:hypothetical protein
VKVDLEGIILEKNHILRYVVASLVFLSLTVSLTGQRRLNQPFGQGEQSQKINLQVELKKSGSMFLDSILNENAERIVALWSESGVAVGIDGPVLSTSEIKKEFQAKSGSFCLFFVSD